MTPETDSLPEKRDSKPWSVPRGALYALLLTLLVWVVFSWPLPRYMASGIPSSHSNVEKHSVRTMIQGDHLQILYNFWLFADMASGKTPWFHNLYEFNVGDDAARRSNGSFNLPLSPVFTIGYWIGGRAFGWNLVGIFALWITLLFTWLTARKFLPNDRHALLLSLIAITLPYRWAMILGGSPSGYAMAWAALLLWGLDEAVRRGSFLGGISAALALIFAYWNDGHVFFFCVLLLPMWGLLLVIHERNIPWNAPERWLKHIVALLPALFTVLYLAFAGNSHMDEKAATTIAAGRTWHEVLLFTPHPRGLIQWRAFGPEASIYFGFTFFSLVIIGVLSQVGLLLKDVRKHWRSALFLLVLITFTALIVIIALGPRGPANGKLFALARDAVPHFSKIRQSPKALTVVPPLLAILVVASAQAFARLQDFVMCRAMLPWIAGTLLIVEHAAQVRPTICILDKEQAAYAAVAETAAQQGEEARAIVLPLWPGDSSWASLYEHYVSLYRIRMVNGYRPVIPLEYIENVFNRLGRMNVGELGDEQLAVLRQMGVRYVILHEDAFPEKVSPFPVAYTLKRLLEHPNLRLLKQGQNVWSFAIHDNPSASPTPAAPENWKIFFPTREREAEHFAAAGAAVIDDDAAGGGRYLRLQGDGAFAQVGAFKHWSAPDAQLLVRMRGTAQGTLGFGYEDGHTNSVPIASDGDIWRWKAFPLGSTGPGRLVSPVFTRQSGVLELDLALYTSGRLPVLAPGESVSIPAPLFFHAGYTDLEANAVILQPARQPDDEIFYGPRLPLEPGDYTFSLVYAADAAPGTELGSIQVRGRGLQSERVPVLAGQTATGTFSNREADFPLRFGFTYTRNASMAIRSVEFTRIR